MISRDTIPRTRRWVIKIGSALLTSDGKGLSREALAPWVEQMASLRKAGVRTVEKLLETGCTKAGRKALAAETGIDEKQLLRYVNMADLFRDTAYLNGLHLGDAFDEAVLTWCESLSEADEDDRPGEI